MRHTQITDLIWCGGELREGEWEALHNLGVRWNLSLQAEARDHYGTLSPEAELWLPARDWYMPTTDQLYAATRFVAAAVQMARPILVHCREGIGRAPLTLACYFITTGMSCRQSLDQIREKRPIVEPNEGQIDVVRDFERLWKAGVFS